MDSQQLDRFRRRLEAERTDADRRIIESQAKAQSAVDPDDNEMEEQAAESLAADIELTMAQRHTDRHNAIDAALDRIANGEYGCCEECEEDIPIARLEIEPTALRCTDCQSRHEVQAQLTL